MPAPNYYANVQLSFAHTYAFNVPLTTEVAVHDINDDGHLDFIIGYGYAPARDVSIPLRFFLGDGSGGFTESAATLFAGSTLPSTTHAREFVFADFNGDGRDDIFVADHGMDVPPFPGFRASLMLSTATGFVNATASLPETSGFNHSATAGDIDGDGDLDLFVGDMDGLGVGPFFLINDGTGAFTRRDADFFDLGFYNRFTSSVFFDADNDGDQDLFLGSLGGNPEVNDESRLLLNDGTGIFSTGSSVPGATDGLNDPVVDTKTLDLNGDGFLDLVLSYAVNTYASGRIQVLFNNGLGQFTDATSNVFGDGALPHWIVRSHFVDVNGDGHLDFVGSFASGSPIRLNDGFGHFVALPWETDPVENHAGTPYFTPGDFNEDGRMDFLTNSFSWDGVERVDFLFGQDIGLAHTGDSASNGLMGDADSEILTGGGGDDVIFGAQGDDLIIGGTGSDYLHGGAGVDTAIYDGSASGVVVNLALGTGTGGDAEGDRLRLIENLTGSSHADVLTGDAGSNVLSGGAGADVLSGGAGVDTVSFATEGGTAGVTLFLQAGMATDQFGQIDTLSGIENAVGSAFADTFNGDAQANGLEGRGGADRLFGGGGADILHGDDGNDTLVGNADIFAQESDILNGDAGDDLMYAEFTDTINGGSGRDSLIAVNSFNFNLDMTATSIEYAVMDFGDDVVTAAGQTVRVDVFASGGNDSVTGSNFDDLLFGGVGADTLVGGVGADAIVGEGGIDSLNGGDGDDAIYFDAQDSFVFGGAGYDAGYITPRTGAGATINLGAASLEFIQDFAGAGDTILGSTLTQGFSAFAGGGADTVDGSAFADIVWGEAGDDVLNGAAGNDVLVGGAGLDRINGGAGNDALYGGAADGVADTFVFHHAGAADADAVYDFVAGVDKIDLSVFGSTFAGVGIVTAGGSSVVYLNGQQIATIVGVTGLTAGDFILSGGGAPAEPESVLKAATPLIQPTEAHDAAAGPIFGSDPFETLNRPSWAHGHQGDGWLAVLV